MEIHVQGRRITAESEDLSRRGMFVRLLGTLPVGAEVELRVDIPLEATLVLRARVGHVLIPAEAKALGRSPGVGFEFIELGEVARRAIDDYIDSLIEDTTRPGDELLHTARLIVADPRTPLLVRLTNSLEGANGFEVETVTNGADALVAALERRPDAILAAADMPFMSGLELVEKLRGHERLRGVPVIIMTASESDLLRLEAFRAGASDVITKPFTDEEVAIRLRRLTMPMPHTDANLRGVLGEISLGTLLSLLEFERKTGELLLRRKNEQARLEVREGRVVQIEGPVGALEPIDRMMLVLDWQQGAFEFTSMDIHGDDELGMSTQQLLLEHARAVDES